MTPNEEPTTEAGWRAASQRLHESGDDEPYATDTEPLAAKVRRALDDARRELVRHPAEGGDGVDAYIAAVLETTETLVMSAIESDARATATPGLRGKVFIRTPDDPDRWTAWGDVVPGIPYQYISGGFLVRVELAASGESEARATATPGLREALMALYEAVGAAPAVRETPRQRKVLEAWKAVRADLSASGETDA